MVNILRVKNSFDKTVMVAKTLPGFEDVLVGEITKAGGIDVQAGARSVTFTGDMEVLYRANYTCRTALRILVPIAEFQVLDEQMLYNRVRALNWSRLMRPDQTIAVEATLVKSSITHSHFAALRVKDAIVDYWRAEKGVRPDVDTQKPDVLVQLHINGTDAHILFDSSGEPLFKRGYRKATGEAPMNEVLAAGMLLIAGYDGSQVLFDPMTGSGTLAIEAGMIAQSIPAGYYREHYGFMSWDNFNKELWSDIKADADELISDQEEEIFCSDLSSKMVEIAQRNIRSAHLHKDITLSQADFLNNEAPADKGILVMNPPYGERLKSEDLEAFYGAIGSTLKHYYSGWQAWIISSDYEALKYIGLKPFKKVTLFNGPLECRYAGFELFEGKRREMLEKKKEM